MSLSGIVKIIILKDFVKKELNVYHKDIPKKVKIPGFINIGRLLENLKLYLLAINFHKLYKYVVLK